MPFETQDHQRIDVFLGRKFVQNLNDGTVTVSQRASIKRFIEDEKITKANQSLIRQLHRLCEKLMLNMPQKMS